jgi:hypothetical protein
MKILVVLGITLHLGGCAMAVPAPIGTTVVTQHPADYIPPRPPR